MQAVTSSAMKKNFDSCLDRVQSEEPLIIAREDAVPLVVLTLDDWNALKKAENNLEYLLKLDRSFAQIEAGKNY